MQKCCRKPQPVVRADYKIKLARKGAWNKKIFLLSSLEEIQTKILTKIRDMELITFSKVSRV